MSRAGFASRPRPLAPPPSSLLSALSLPAAVCVRVGRRARPQIDEEGHASVH